jgi:hypothetical protein
LPHRNRVKIWSFGLYWLIRLDSHWNFLFNAGFWKVIMCWELLFENCRSIFYDVWDKIMLWGWNSHMMIDYFFFLLKVIWGILIHIHRLFILIGLLFFLAHIYNDWICLFIQFGTVCWIVGIFFFELFIFFNLNNSGSVFKNISHIWRIFFLIIDSGNEKLSSLSTEFIVFNMKRTFVRFYVRFCLLVFC